MSKVFIGTGRRKSSVAQVKLVSGSGKITVNGRDVREFFPYETNVMDLKQPLVATNNEKIVFFIVFNFNIIPLMRVNVSYVLDKLNLNFACLIFFLLYDTHSYEEIESIFYRYAR